MHDKVLIVNNFYAFDPREWQYFLRQLMANESRRSSERKRKRGRKSDIKVLCENYTTFHFDGHDAAQFLCSIRRIIR